MTARLPVIIFLLLSTISIQAREIQSDPYIVPDTALGKLNAMAVPFTVKAWVDEFHFDHRYRMELFLQAGMDINAIEPQYGESALSVGILQDDPDLLSWLINHGASLSQLTKRKPDLMAIVLSRSSSAVIKILLDHGVNIDQIDSRGSSALHYASTNGASDAVQRLLDMKSNVNSVNQKGETPLTLAAKSGHLNTVKILIDNKAKVNAVTRTSKGRISMSALTSAVSSGHKNIVSYLLSVGADIDYICLLHAIREQRVQILELLLSDLNKKDSYYQSKQSILQFAVNRRNSDAIALLLKNIDKLTPDLDNAAALMQTLISQNNIELINAFLPHADLKQEAMPLLDNAINYSRLDILKLLLGQLPINKDQRNKLIAHTVSNGFCDALPLLIDRDIQVSGNIIYNATTNGNPDCVRALLQAGADPDTKNSNGNSLLMSSVERGYISIIKLLLAAGADKSLSNKHGQTALDIATSLDYKICAKLLSD